MSDSPHIATWTAEPLAPAVKQGLERVSRAPGVVRIAVMPDVHPAAGVNNGCVIATRKLIYPAAVGGDIGCGFATVALNGPAGELARRPAAEAVLAALPRVVPVMRHRRRDDPPELAGALAADNLSAPQLAAFAARDGRLELGTLGRGNHFLEFQQDETGRMWLMVHSGSRAMGQHITNHHRRTATPAGGGLAWLDADDPAGQAYLRDAAWARAYAAESRRRMLHAAAEVAGDIVGTTPDWSTLLNTDHNHVQAEDHDGQSVYVHRKGANTADCDAPNVIPGSMASHTFHVAGRGAPDALRSSSHGAGRRISRGAARHRLRRTDVTRELAGVWVDPAIVPRLTDEAPSAYKDLDAVMRAQHDLVRIVRRVRPVLVYKG
ncbi:MAG TPA: RtcB family protein, partial [Phycisphaerae bacterium]|nr:RtcB family protein [Phycisphaerae bacterium]